MILLQPYARTPTAGAAWLTGTLIIVNRNPPGEPRFSEDDLIASIRHVLSGDFPGVVVGPGDDAAVVHAGPGDSVLTTDMLVEGVHFVASATPARDLGAKAIVANLSDIAAMGATPRHAVVSLGLSDRTDPPWVAELFEGMLATCGEYGCALVGGDLSRSPVIVISVAVTGEVAAERAVLRSGAAPGHRLAVTGCLGAAAGGLALLRADGVDPAPGTREAMESAWGRALLERHLHPTARVGEGRALAECGATAMMDLSDGLALDLSRLCRESGAGARVELAAIPVAAELHELARVLSIDPLRLALSGGEDYELLAALPPDAVGEARRRISARFGIELTEIGEITEEPRVVAVDAEGGVTPLAAEGWDHFGSR